MDRTISRFPRKNSAFDAITETKAKKSDIPSPSMRFDSEIGGKIFEILLEIQMSWIFPVLC